MRNKKSPFRPMHAVLIISGGLILLVSWIASHIKMIPVSQLSTPSAHPNPSPTISASPTPTSSPTTLPPAQTAPSSQPTPQKSSWHDDFDQSRIIEEANTPEHSSDSHWWINSGGRLIIENGIGKTMQGEASSEVEWHKRYQSDNPEDTDEGNHPQNIFRLVQRQTWKNLSQSAYFRINHDNLSNSSNRNESNGLFLMNRYQNGDTLYYTGIRVDGAAVIKKKTNGTYFTLGYKQMFGGGYNHDSNPNVLPHGSWIGLKAEIRDGGNGSVNIKLYTTTDKSDNWKLSLELTDNGKVGGSAITQAGYGGIRTDFMDVEFDDYKISEL